MKVQYDGAPHLMQAANSDLFTVVNTPFFVAARSGQPDLFPQRRREMVSPPPIQWGRSRPSAPFPGPFSIWRIKWDIRIPSNPFSDAQFANLQIVTATEPTELIWTDGPPQLATIPGHGTCFTSLTRIRMSLSKLPTQRNIRAALRAVVCSPGTNGPWAFVLPDQLPPDFACIPADGPKADVLASVAGTPAGGGCDRRYLYPANRRGGSNHFDQPPVEYDGDPNFQAIPGSPCSYAVNTLQWAWLLNGVYYCCDNSVWYTAAGAEWAAAALHPRAEARSIPSPPPARFIRARSVHLWVDR